jgi:peroxiredoxin
MAAARSMKSAHKKAIVKQQIKNLFGNNQATKKSMEALKPGMPAPDFTLPATSGETVSLSQYHGQPVVLIFYPADESPVCSNQLALYNEAIHLFEDHDAKLLGISIDDLDSHQKFADNLGLDFPLLADDDPPGGVARKYGVFDPKDGKCNRALFVVGPEGDIHWREVVPRSVNPGAHGILDALESMD